jgi:hypothetical protein
MKPAILRTLAVAQVAECEAHDLRRRGEIEGGKPSCDAVAPLVKHEEGKCPSAFDKWVIVLYLARVIKDVEDFTLRPWLKTLI